MPLRLLHALPLTLLLVLLLAARAAGQTPRLLSNQVYSSGTVGAGSAAVLAPRVVLGGARLGEVQSASPEECAERCREDAECSWFNACGSPQVGVGAARWSEVAAADRRHPRPSGWQQPSSPALCMQGCNVGEGPPLGFQQCSLLAANDSVVPVVLSKGDDVGTTAGKSTAETLLHTHP